MSATAVGSSCGRSEADMTDATVAAAHGKIAASEIR